MAKVVTAIFRNRAAAESAATALMRGGFRREDISVLMSESTRGREFGIVETNKIGDGAAAGAATGAAVGATIAAIAAVGALAIPGVGIIAAGPIVAALAGAGAGATAGGVVGALVGAGIPEHEAKFFGPEVERGGILVGLHVKDEKMVETAKMALKNAGGVWTKAA